MQRFINALARKVVDLIGMGLKRGAVNQNVELAKGFIGFINRNFVERQFFTSPEIRNQKSEIRIQRVSSISRQRLIFSESSFRQAAAASVLHQANSTVTARPKPESAPMIIALLYLSLPLLL